MVNSNHPRKIVIKSVLQDLSAEPARLQARNP
ncbi:hypothetical protein BDGGKGIB_00402 [Nodularia sphaerocarpa UHCC 0038]|nr:hypothetical protein BDGGKGIB_00402 [Nodularia sphaerocarpa UHCC 0038]